MPHLELVSEGESQVGVRARVDSMFNVLKQCRYGAMVFNRNDAYIGRSLELYGEFSQGEVELFEQFVGAGDVVIEVGANVGAHTLRLAQLAGPTGQVHAFEPQRIVFQTLCANLALNSIANTHTYLSGVGDRDGEVQIPPLDSDRPNNFGGLEVGDDASWRVGAREENLERVPLVTLDRHFPSLPRLRLLKVDVEGMELDVLRGARELILRTKPLLYVENDRVAKAEALVSYMRALGYRLYWHNPLLYSAANYFRNVEDVFPGIVSINVLAVASDAAISLQGFAPVESAIHPALGG